MNIIRLIIYLSIFIIIKYYLLKKKNEFFNINNSILDIDKIYIINLEKDIDRWSVINKQCKINNLKIERFNAIYGKELPNDHFDIKKYFPENHYLTPGQIGCALSHIKIWEEAYQNNYEYIFILEDDAIIPNNFIERVTPILNSLPKDWDYLSLNCAYCYGKHFNKNLVKVLYNLCTVSYMLSKNGIKKILDIISKHKINEAIDDYLCTHFFKNTNSFLAKDHFIIMNTDDFESNIGVGSVGKNHNIKYI
jgi:GR25 family glycosyltransferase involved in LPS biosynthesis